MYRNLLTANAVKEVDKKELTAFLLGDIKCENEEIMMTKAKACIFVLVIISAAYLAMYYESRIEKVVTVEDMWIGDNPVTNISFQMFFSEDALLTFSDTDGDTYCVRSVILVGLTNNEKEILFLKLKPGEIYVITTYGWRIPDLKMYPHVVDATPVSS